MVEAPALVELPPAEEINLEDPQQRFQVVSFARLSGVVHATVLDRMTEERNKVVVGDILDQYTVSRIDMTKRSLELRGPDKKVVVIKWQKRPNP